MIPRWTAVLSIFLVPALIWLYGWRTIDTVEWRTITAAPFSVDLDPEQQFLYGSPLTFLLGSYYRHQGLGHVHAFVVVHGLGLVFFAAALFRCLTQLCGATGRAAGLIVLAGSPLLFVVLTWIGKSDTYLLAFYFLLLTTRSPVMIALLCVLMIGCHRELALAMLIAHLILRGASAPVLIGAAAGVAASVGFTRFMLTAVPASRIDFLIGHARELLDGVRSHPIVYLAATLGPFWLYAIRPSILNVRRVAVLVIAFALACLAFDFTRVFVIAATPLLLLLTEEVVAELRQTGGVRLWGRAVTLGLLWPLALLQLQVLGAKVQWIRGIEWVLTR
jgi:hypothetical protein